MIYRLEIHQTETGKWFAQVWDGDVTTGSPLYETEYYDDMREAYNFAEYEVHERMYMDREARALARLGPDDRPGESEKD